MDSKMNRKNRKWNKPKLGGTAFGNLVAIETDPELDPVSFVCFRCWEKGHDQSQCDNYLEGPYCLNCGRWGAFVNNCPRCSKEWLRIVESESNSRRIKCMKQRNYRLMDEWDFLSKQDVNTVEVKSNEKASDTKVHTDRNNSKNIVNDTEVRDHKDGTEDAVHQENPKDKVLQDQIDIIENTKQNDQDKISTEKIVEDLKNALEAENVRKDESAGTVPKEVMREVLKEQNSNKTVSKETPEEQIISKVQTEKIIKKVQTEKIIKEIQTEKIIQEIQTEKTIEKAPKQEILEKEPKEKITKKTLNEKNIKEGQKEQINTEVHRHVYKDILKQFSKTEMLKEIHTWMEISSGVDVILQASSCTALEHWNRLVEVMVKMSPDALNIFRTLLDKVTPYLIKIRSV